jgi:hypothetical protein
MIEKKETRDKGIQPSTGVKRDEGRYPAVLGKEKRGVGRQPSMREKRRELKEESHMCGGKETRHPSVREER